MVVYNMAYPKYPGMVFVCLSELQYKLLRTIIWSAQNATTPLLRGGEAVERSHCLFMIIIFILYSSEIDFYADHASCACQSFTIIPQTRHSPIN